MSVVFSCTKEQCERKTFGTFDGHEWHPSVERSDVCSCPYPLEQMYVCDACGEHVHGKYDDAEREWRKPGGWREMTLTDWQVHGCTLGCWNEATSGATSDLSTATEVRLRLRVEARAQAFSTQGSAPEGERFDDRTPSDAFALP